MTKGEGSRPRITLLLLLVMQTACISHKRVVPQDQRLLPAQLAARSDLLRNLVEKSRQIETLAATVALDVAGGGEKTGVLTEYRQTRGYVLVEKPTQQIRIKV